MARMAENIAKAKLIWEKKSSVEVEAALAAYLDLFVAIELYRTLGAQWILDASMDSAGAMIEILTAILEKRKCGE